MKIGVSLAATAVVLLTVAMMTGVGWDRPPVAVEQQGYRGVAIEHISNPRRDAERAALNVVPPPPYPLDEVTADTPKASEVYENVPILGHLPEPHFMRLMAAMTEWVSPEQGCNYCHNPENLADDDVYTKTVARTMLQMTMHINGDWKDHVKDTGVTCYTCHRGNPVPEQAWVFDSGPPQALGQAGNRAGQNIAGAAVGLTSLPLDPLAAYLADDAGDAGIRVQASTALPTGPGATIQDTEKSYALMMHMSQALGVNCTQCHNSRSFSDWQQSSPSRVTAWHGIQMARSLNTEYLTPLQSVLPPERLGPHGDVPKVSCATCHQGVAKPLYGVSMLEDYPSLGSVK